MKRFVVTGCSRSGTGYAAMLMRTLGAACGHEDVFGAQQMLGRRPVRWAGHDGDSSWLAVPFLPLDGVVVLHQVRDPLEVVRSHGGIGFFADGHPGPFARAIRRYAPEVFVPDGEAERAALHWRIWNTRVEPHAAITYRLEDLDPGLLVRLAEIIELDLSEASAAEALERTPRNINARGRDETVDWEAIAPLVEDLAVRYGYGSSRPSQPR